MSQEGLLNVTSIPSVPTSFVTDSGTAVPSANVLNIFGGTDITTGGAGNTVTITFTGTVFNTLTGNSGGAVGPTAGNINTLGTGSITVVGNPGTSTLTAQLTGLNNHAVQVGAGTATLTQLTVGTNGQVLIGATGADPAFATLTSSDNSILFTPGANTLSLQVNSAKIGETITGDSGGALSPTLGNWNILGALAGAGASPVTTIGAASTLMIKVQTAQAIGATSAINVGLAAFNSANFTVDGNGFVSLKGSDAIQTITGDSGGAESPAAGNFNFTGGTTGLTFAGSASTETLTGTLVVANGGTGNTTFSTFAPIVGGTSATNPLQSASTGQATSGFVFTSTGAGSVPTFQAVSAAGAVSSITGNSGGAEVPSAGNFNILGTGSITIAGSANTETVQLTGLTAHAVLVGAGTATITKIGPSASTGQVLQNNAAGDPSYSTAIYPSTTTINQILFSSAANTIAGITASNNGVLISSAGGVPSWLAAGTTGQILTATTGSPATWASPATSGTVTSVSVVSANGFAGTVATATTTPAITISTTITGVLSGNGTAISGSAVTQYDVLVGGATNAISSVGPGSAGQILQSGGNAANPAYSTSTYPATNAINTLLYASSANVMSALATGNNGVLITSATGVPSWLADGTTGQFLTATTGGPATWTTVAPGGVSSVTGTANQILASPTTGAVVLTLIGPYTPATYTAHGVLVGEGTGSIVAVGPSASTGQILQNNAAADPSYSTATYPSTTTISQILYSSAANVVSGLATANGGVLDTTATGVPQVDTTNFQVLSTGVQVKGNNTNTTPPAGFIGELIEGFQGTPQALTTGTPLNIASIALTPGVWNVSSNAIFTSGGNPVVVAMVTDMSAVSGTLSGNYGKSQTLTQFNPSQVITNWNMCVADFRVLLSGNTTYYLVAEGVFTVAALSAYGRISATRVG